MEFGGGCGEFAALEACDCQVLAADGAEAGGGDAGLFGHAEGALRVFGRDGDDDARLGFAEESGVEASTGD